MYKHFREFICQEPCTDIVPDLESLKRMVVSYEPIKTSLDTIHMGYLDDFLHRLFSFSNTVYMPAAPLCVSMVETLEPSNLNEFLRVFLYKERALLVKSVTVNNLSNNFIIEISTPTATEGFGEYIINSANIAQRKLLIDAFLAENP